MDVVDCDLLCIGGGLGGFAAAARAQLAGLRTVVLERSSLIGGVGAYSGGDVWVPNSHLLDGGEGTDSRADAEAYLSYLGGDGDNFPHDRRLRQTFLDRAPEAIRWFAERAGVHFELAGSPDQYYPEVAGSSAGARHISAHLPGTDLGEWRLRLRRHAVHPSRLTARELSGFGDRVLAERELHDLLPRREEQDYLTQGPGLVGSFVRAAVIRGGAEVRLRTRGVELVVEAGRVVGAIADQEGGNRTRFNARAGVLIATGGYGYAPYAAMMEGLPSFKEQAPPVVFGDGLLLAESVGAAVIRAGQAFITLGFAAGGALHPDSDAPIYYPAYETFALPHNIVVNQRGERFGDETFYGTYNEAIRRYDSTKKQFVNFPCFLVLDNQFAERYPLRPLRTFPAGDLVRADTLDDLAGKLGVDGDGLRATVASFNAGVEAGVDPLGRGSLRISRSLGDPTYANPNLGTVSRPPFWGVRLEIVGVGISSHGLWIDDQARVLRRSGEPIPGLFASGNAVAFGDVPFGYESGLANARNITYAFVAASAMVGG